MAKFYRIVSIMPSKLVGPLMELLEGEGEVDSIQAIDTKAQPVKRSYPANRARTKQTGRELAEKLILDAGAKGLLRANLIKAFVADGRAKNSITPVVSSLHRNKIIQKTDDDRYIHKNFV